MDILYYFPERIQVKLQEYISEDLEEIRIRVGKPMILKFSNKEIVVKYVITTQEILEIMQKICDNSIYTYQNQICNGYITIPGGHRIGVTGNAIFKEHKVTNINYIASLNFRIAKQIIGASQHVLKYVLKTEENSVYNTLIVSPPGAGKTTVLRDLIRVISNGEEAIQYRGITVAVVDERGEIAAMNKGKIENDLGIRTDVIDNVPKALGMRMLVRSMAPKVIIADEIRRAKRCRSHSLCYLLWNTRNFYCSWKNHERFGNESLYSNTARPTSI